MHLGKDSVPTQVPIPRKGSERSFLCFKEIMEVKIDGCEGESGFFSAVLPVSTTEMVVFCGG